jgi:hypothetical protein
MKRLSIAGLCLLALAVTAAPASAEAPGQLMPNALPGAQVREGTSQLAYNVHVPCPRNERVVDNWLYYHACDYKIRLGSGSALVGPSGDAYTYRIEREYTAGDNENYLMDIKIVDDRKREPTETLFVDMMITVRECRAWAPNPRYPACHYETGIRRWYQGTIHILDNDRGMLITRPDAGRISPYVRR